uniref:Elongation factor P n=1 Tax=Aegilops tauschii TaxID=37682 RepID=M8CB31_AEGTA
MECFPLTSGSHNVRKREACGLRRDTGKYNQCEKLLYELFPLHATTEFLHVKPGKGAAFVRTKMRNYITGNTVEKTFRAGSTIQEASISKETKQFTYKDGSQFVFMDLTSFEESRLNESDVGDRQKWLKEGMDCTLLYWNGRIIDFDLPITVRLTVTEADPGQGDSAQGGTKPATLETGAVVNVPSFVDVGDDVLIDSRTGQYMSRA